MNELRFLNAQFIMEPDETDKLRTWIPATGLPARLERRSLMIFLITNTPNAPRVMKMV